MIRLRKQNMPLIKNCGKFMYFCAVQGMKWCFRPPISNAETLPTWEATALTAKFRRNIR